MLCEFLFLDRKDREGTDLSLNLKQPQNLDKIYERNSPQDIIR